MLYKSGKKAENIGQKSGILGHPRLQLYSVFALKKIQDYSFIRDRTIRSKPDDQIINSKRSQSFYLGTRVVKRRIPDQSTGPYQTITESRIGALKALLVQPFCYINYLYFLHFSLICFDRRVKI